MSTQPTEAELKAQATPPAFLGVEGGFNVWFRQAIEKSDSLVETTKKFDDWTELTGNWVPEGMKIYQKTDPNSSLMTVRGEIDGIQAPAYDVAKWIFSMESFPVLDKMAQIDKAKVVEEFSQRDVVMYCPYNVPWPLYPREFVWFQHWDTLPSEEEVIYGFSVVHKDVPVQSSPVRGTIYDSGYVFRPTSENTCKISYVVCINPGGWVPSWANTKLAEQTYGLKHTKEYFAKNPVKVTTNPFQKSK